MTLSKQSQYSMKVFFFFTLGKPPKKIKKYFWVILVMMIVMMFPKCWPLFELSFSDDLGV